MAFLLTPPEMDFSGNSNLFESLAEVGVEDGIGVPTKPTVISFSLFADDWDSCLAMENLGFRAGMGMIGTCMDGTLTMGLNWFTDLMLSMLGVDLFYTWERLRI